MASYSFYLPIVSVGELNVDWMENEDQHVLTLDVPGVRTSDLVIKEVAPNVLHLEGVYKDGEILAVNPSLHAVERPRGRFIRQYKLPDNTVLAAKKVLYENGLLHIIVPKRKLRVRNIPIMVTRL
ncbi:hypothetical protein KP509_01G042300 [Ceratopteris richardii]|uniref:SHSP domain-containing protein n=1 Tax=Ceratopteris richardii TaxID=49495 RepID=A0A8T2VKP1_CERRI|nr:hypothetical protein KP509_01G042300 [Ceratopteris richardii]